MIPDLSDEKEMARRGRLSALYKARQDTAEKARDIAVRMLNNLDNSAVWEPQVVADYFTEIQLLTQMIKEVKESK
jgi:predicted nucleic acid-binding protein